MESRMEKCYFARIKRDYADLMRSYIVALRRGHIRLTDREDELVWQKRSHRLLYSKSGIHSIEYRPLTTKSQMVVEGPLEDEMPSKIQNLYVGSLEQSNPNLGNPE
jgi:hypothetical protein